MFQSGCLGQDLEDELDAMIKEGRLAEAQLFGASTFLEPTVVEGDTDLRNAHRRDGHVRFEAKGHKYYLRQEDGELEFHISVSGVWARYFGHFDAEATIARYYVRWAADPSSKYFEFIKTLRYRGILDADIALRIKSMWVDAGELASALGTRMHREIEMALTGNAFDASMGEMQMFQRFVAEVLEVRRWRLYRAEWTIYDEGVMVAGQIDAVFEDGSGALHMLDWKRVRHPLLPRCGEKFQRYGVGLCGHLLDNHFNHYAVQQNLYAAILRRRYAVCLTSMSLMQIHPDVMGYQVIEVPEWRVLADSLLDAAGATTSSKAPLAECPCSST